MEDDKKKISEYVKVISEANKCRKAKQLTSAIDKFHQCLSMVNSSELIDRRCETHFYLGNCYLKLNNIKESYDHLIESNNLINRIKSENIPIHKIKGRLSADIILLKYATENSQNALTYSKDIIFFFEASFQLIDKLNIFCYFIKELLYFMKKSKKVTNFIDEYESAKNEIVYNQENSICSSLKSSFQTLMNSSTKVAMLQKNDVLFYNFKYGFGPNHPLISFFEKNNDLMKENNPQKAKSSLDSFIKANKIKISVTSTDLFQEQKMRMDNFNNLFSVLSGSFNVIFKKHFSLVQKLDMKLDSPNIAPQKNITPVLKSNKEGQIVFNSNYKKSPFSEANLQSSEFGRPLTKNNNVKKNISTEENMSNCNKNNKTTTGHKSSLTNKALINVNILDESESCSKKPVTEPIKPFELTSETDHKISSISETKQVHHSSDKSHNKREEINDYDHYRIENISSLNDHAFEIKRKRSLILFKIILDEFGREKQVRKSDLINSKIQSYVKNYSKISLKGNHKTYGESLSVNQDVCFSFDNFLLHNNLYYFGVCDGHGDLGHLVSDHAKIYLPCNIQYIELDNCLIKQKKDINNLMGSLYNLNEKSNVKEMNIIKYFYDKFSINSSDMSLYKKSFNEVNNVMKEAFKWTHEDLLTKNFDSSSSGSTVCTLLINGKKIFLANIGDSRAILCSSSGNKQWTASQLTKDHKPNDQKEMDRIIKSKGQIKRCFNEDKSKETGPYRVWFLEDSKGPGLAMSRSLGDNSAKEIGVIAEPDIYEYSLNLDDKFIILASDGIWEYISSEEAMEIVKPIYLDTSKTSTDACSILTKTATNIWKKKKGNTVDDISCIIIFLQVVA